MNIFERFRRYIIIKTAESYYERMVLQCNDLYETTRKHHYIIVDPWLGNKVILTNREDFRNTKRAINDSGIRMAVRSGELPVLTDSVMPDVHSGCFYSSLLKWQYGKCTSDKARRKIENDIEGRRRYYIKWTLENAKVRRHKTLKERREERIVRRQLRSIRRQKTQR